MFVCRNKLIKYLLVSRFDCYKDFILEFNIEEEWGRFKWESIRILLIQQFHLQLFPVHILDKHYKDNIQSFTWSFGCELILDVFVKIFQLVKIQGLPNGWRIKLFLLTISDLYFCFNYVVIVVCLWVMIG